MSVSELLKTWGPLYLQKHAQRMTPQQRKVLRAVIACRENRLGTIRYRCTACGLEQTVPRSCCNRHCSRCQWKRQQEWLQRQQDKLLPCHYFMITFTLPAELRPLATRHPELVYPAILKAAADSLRIGATNPRFLGVREVGFTGVLHTWGRDLNFHPHAHFIVPGGGINADGEWKNSRLSVYVPEQVLEALYRKRLYRHLCAAGLRDEIPERLHGGRLIVDSKAIGTAEHALKYLAPYVSRGSVADWRVTAFENPESADFSSAMMTLQVKRSGAKRYRPVPLRIEEFIRRWLQHVCPRGLHRVRHYGFMNCHSRRTPEELRILIAVSLDRRHYLQPEPTPLQKAAAMTCPRCGDCMRHCGYQPARVSDAHTAQPREPP